MRGAAAVVVVCAVLAVVGADTGAQTRASGAARAARKPKPAAPRVLVRFADEVVTEADVRKRLEEIPEQFRAQYGTPEGKRLLLERMVEEKVWLKGASKAGVAERPEVQAQLERQRRDLLVRTYVNEVMAANSAPSDSEMMAYYEEHETEYGLPATVTVSHLQTRTESEAKRIKGWLDRGQSWDAMVKRYSADTTTRRSGGRLGTVTREGLFPVIGTQPALAESAFALGAGRVGGPYGTKLGHHLLRVENVVQDSVRPFDAVRPMLQRQLTNKRQQDFYKAKLGEMRERFKVREDSAAIRDFLSAKKNAREMFEEAQKAGAPTARIQAYRQLLEAYPDSGVSPQAQFMIGFVFSEELKDYDQAEAAFKQVLQRYANSELAPSARWMIEHMRTEEAPAFLNLEADTTRPAAPASPGKPK